MTGKSRERTVATNNPKMVGKVIKTHDTYVRYLHPYLSQQTIKNTPNKLRKLNAINSP